MGCGACLSTVKETNNKEVFAVQTKPSSNIFNEPPPETENLNPESQNVSLKKNTIKEALQQSKDKGSLCNQLPVEDRKEVNQSFKVTTSQFIQTQKELESKHKPNPGDDKESRKQQRRSVNTVLSAGEKYKDKNGNEKSVQNDCNLLKTIYQAQNQGSQLDKKVGSKKQEALDQSQINIEINDVQRLPNNSRSIPQSYDSRPNPTFIKETQSTIKDKQFEDPFESIFEDYHLKKKSIRKSIQITLINIPKGLISTQPRSKPVEIPPELKVSQIAHKKKAPLDYEQTTDNNRPCKSCSYPQIFSFMSRKDSRLRSSQGSNKQNRTH